MASTATLDEFEAGLDRVRDAPADEGTLELIVRRPAENERELLESGRLELESGLVGDMWAVRPSSSSDDGGPNPESQVTMMNARAAALVAGGEPEGWAQAGDQLYVDLDISHANLPAGTRLGIGEAVVEVTEAPHLGCGKFARRFGVDAVKLVNSRVGRDLRLRGLNARVITPGTVRTGDRIRKLGT